MSRRRRTPPSPLPLRAGIEPVRARTPQADGPWPTLAAWLGDRFPPMAGAPLAALLQAGDVVRADGTPVGAEDPFAPATTLWFHRPLRPEPVVAGRLETLCRDDHLLVLDKPHGLATTPNGVHVAETALVRARRSLAAEGRDDLAAGVSPLHRLDRLTAGVLVLGLVPEERAAYQLMIQSGGLEKEYLAVVRSRAADIPERIEARLVKRRGELQTRVEDGEPNSTSLVEVLGERDGGAGGALAGPVALVRVRPLTGRTHQIRAHLALAGAPIVGDPLYPELTGDLDGDPAMPLQLLAQALAFDDPVTGQRRRFRSRRALAAWSEQP